MFWSYQNRFALPTGRSSRRWENPLPRDPFRSPPERVEPEASVGPGKGRCFEELEDAGWIAVSRHLRGRAYNANHVLPEIVPTKRTPRWSKLLELSQRTLWSLPGSYSRSGKAPSGRH